MQNMFENRYKTCRKNAGFTQESAAEKLHVSTRTLSDYENGGKVPDEIVALMTDVYSSPLLAWWHLKENNALGKFLPDIFMPQTNGDMAFQLVLAEDELSPAVAGIKQIMADGRIDEDELETLSEKMSVIKNVNGKLMSVLAYSAGFNQSQGG